MTAMAPTASMPMSAIMRLPNINILLLPPAPPADQQREKTGNKKENTVHDAKRPARLQHRTRLINLHIHTTHAEPVAIAHADGEEGRAALVDRAAVVLADHAQLVDAGDQRADETEVDEGDEESVGFRAVVGEERRDGPDGAEDGDDEED